MPNSIEIFQNTLLKLIVRQGGDSDRKLILLDSGELGYSTDTNRLFIGDGETIGGSIVGNKYLTDGNPISLGANAQAGDLVFNTANNTLYKFNGGDYSSLSNWLAVGVIYNTGESLKLDSSNNAISLSSSITVDKISQRSSTYLNLPEKTALNAVNYNWPSGGLQNNLFLGTDIFGNLSWKTPLPLNTYYVSNSASRIPVGMITPFVSGADIPYGWLLCNGNSVAGVTYPALSAAIGTTYGGSGGNFNLPNLTNKTLYGVVNNPATSTTYNLASGNNIGLSAVGTNFIIKAIPDNIVTSTIKIQSPLSATVNGIDITNTSVTTLSGDIVVGLAPIISATTVQTPFNIDPYGRVSAVPVTYAGTIDADVVNPLSYIKFLQTPYKILDITSNTSSRSNVTIYPIITQIPLNAKTVLVDAYMSVSNTNESGIICGACDVSKLGAVDSNAIGNTEYLILKLKTGFIGRSASSNQCMIPLSSNGSSSQLAIRFSVGNLNENAFVRVIGYTL